MIPAAFDYMVADSADAAIAASARRRAVGLVDRCRSEGTDVRSPSDTHRRSRRRRRRPRRVFPEPRTLTQPRSPTSRSRRTGCSTASPRASPGSPSISSATRSSSRVGATPSCVPHADAHFFSSRIAPHTATRVSPGSDGFPFLRIIPSSLCPIRNPNPRSSSLDISDLVSSAADEPTASASRSAQAVGEMRDFVDAVAEGQLGDLGDDIHRVWYHPRSARATA